MVDFDVFKNFQAPPSHEIKGTCLLIINNSICVTIKPTTVVPPLWRLYCHVKKPSKECQGICIETIIPRLITVLWAPNFLRFRVPGCLQVYFMSSCVMYGSFINKADLNLLYPYLSYSGVFSTIVQSMYYDEYV